MTSGTRHQISFCITNCSRRWTGRIRRRPLKVKGGRLTAVGRSEDIMPLAGAETRVIDLKRRRALPGADRGSQRLLGRPGM